MLEGQGAHIPFQQIRATAPTFNGFDLVIAKLEEVSRQGHYLNGEPYCLLIESQKLTIRSQVRSDWEPLGNE